MAGIPDFDLSVECSISSPAANAVYNPPPAGMSVTVTGTASATKTTWDDSTDPPAPDIDAISVGSVSVNFGDGTGAHVAALTLVTGGSYTWSYRHTLIATGNLTITVIATASSGGRTVTDTVTRAIISNDITAPTFQITFPTNGYQHPVGQPLTVRGSASDPQTGVASLTWKLDQGAPQPVTSQADWANWSFVVPKESLASGLHRLVITLKDTQGNSSNPGMADAIIDFEVPQVYRPQVANDLVSMRAYLEDLLAFGRNHVIDGPTGSGVQVDNAKLASFFYQPFGQLANALQTVGLEPVNQLRAAIEILRRYTSDTNAAIGGAPSTAQLIAWWPFDEGTGITAHDASGSGYNGTLSAGSMWAQGRAGSTLSFNGTSQVVNWPSNAIPGSLTNNFTIAFWARPDPAKEIATGQTDAQSGTGGKVVQRYAWGPRQGKTAWGDNHSGVGISLGANGIAVTDCMDPTTHWPSLLVYYPPTTSPSPFSTWVHVAVVYSSKRPKLYINGRWVKDGQQSPKTVHAQPEAIGGISQNYYAGLLDEVRVFNSALSAAEIALLASVRVPSGAVSSAAPTEAGYCQAAYEAILGRIGTSYEEIRLARGAPVEVRDALAKRLGIGLAPAGDWLSQLCLEPETITESGLEGLFGVPDTHRDPLTPGASPLFNYWQREDLHQSWANEDTELFSADGAQQPVIDPDIVTLADLRLAQAGNPAYDLWKWRRETWLTTELGVLQSMCNPDLEAEAKLDELMQYALGHTLAEFDELVQDDGSGTAIGEDLQGWRLDMPAFRRLARLRTLTESGGALSNAEWQDAYAILLQARKRGQFAAWRDAEKAAGITLSPIYFTLTGDLPLLPAWRATYRQRLAWRDRLQSRIDQESSLRDAHAAALAATDQLALPMLRDALVAPWANRLKLAPSEAAEFLTARLLTDLKAAGTQQTTRLLQAIETLQNLVFTLRAGQMAPGHPAGAWTLAYKNSANATVTVEPDHFAGEWQWMGSYDAWRGVMLVFFFPENLLMPTLRPLSAQSQAFQEFLATVRARSRLSRQDARAAVEAYQRKVRGLVVHLPMDEGSGTTARDVSQNGNAAALTNGAAWGTGDLAGSITVSGAAYLQIVHDNLTLKLGASDADFSVSFSFYLRAGFNHQWRMVMHKGMDSNTPANNERTFAIFMNAEDNRLYYRISTASSRDEGGSSNAEIAVNSWTVVEYRKVGRKLQLYLNGVLDSEAALNGAARENTGAIRIGYDGTTTAASFAIKNFQVYNYGAPSAQVSFSDSHTDAGLAALQTQSKNIIQPYINAGRPIPQHLRELFYLAPMEAALRLQQSREFLAARDWYETVYAYRFPDAGRKIYYGLAIEQNQGGLPQRTVHWLLDELNPHTIAGLRTNANPYTRFTLMSLARCFIEQADAEFTADTGPSLARARDLYLSARGLLLLPDFDPPAALTLDNVPLPNPILEALRAHAEIQLLKLRQGRNIAGMKRQVELPASQPATSGLPQIGAGGQLIIPGATARLLPTPYHFRVLLERCKQLTGIAQQMEAAFLAAMEKRDRENYDLLQAGYGLQLAQAGVELQNRRKTEATQSTALAALQRDRAKIQQERYQEWIAAGLNDWEQVMMGAYATAGVAKVLAVGFNTYGQIAANPVGAAGAPFYKLGAIASSVAIAAETTAQIASIWASQERRVQEWELQKSLADQDWRIGEQSRTIALQHEQVVQQEGEIARIQANQAQAVANFLARKFTNAELYEWMSRVLGEVYSYFLQLATSTAQLAQNQLAFERQEPALRFILADYWQAPSNDGASGQNAADRQGLTGSARLLQDITKLDQYAFETDKRKLNLSQTFSLAQIAPYEFARFRQSGALPFATPMSLFDQCFPGHYLRLIKRVRVSVVALIPPVQGIRATLINAGTSWVVPGGGVFQPVWIQRAPEIVALTSPTNASGVFELDTQSEMLMPFEAMGVDTSWEFQMPRAANPFDFNTIADVLVTIDYTALNSFDYREEVINALDRTVEGARAFSLRDAFPDLWYQLHNPDDPTAAQVINIVTTRRDFPPNLEDLSTKHLLLSLLHSRDEEDESAPDPIAALAFTLAKEGISGAATSVNGKISTDDAPLAGTTRSPAGTWTLTLPAGCSAYFANGRIEDILFVITFAGRTPKWPDITSVS